MSTKLTSTKDRALLTNRREIRVRGQGGQGAITVGYIFARAAAMYGPEKKEGILTERYGPEKTGGFAIADVVIQDDYINYPLVTIPDILIVMSKEAMEGEIDNLKDDSVVIYESMMAKIPDDQLAEMRTKYPKRLYVGVPALDMAFELKNKVVMNVVLMAVTVELTNILTRKELQRALLARVPAKFKDLNLNALKIGYEFAEKYKKEMK